MTIEFESGIYALTNVNNDKIYIGSACNLKNRCRRHFANLTNNTHKNIFLQNSFNLHGRDAFEFNVLEFVDIDRLVASEQAWIDKYFDNQKRCYNICKTAGNWSGNKHTQKAKKKIADNNPNKRPVEQWTVDAECIGSYKSISAAAKAVSMPVSLIFVACKKKNSICCGYQWKFANDKRKIEQYFDNSGGKRQICQFDKNGKMITVYNSITLAANKTNNTVSNISKCCRGKIKSSGGFVWKYVK